MAIQYYMRAFNTTLSRYVDWVVNDTPDSLGTFSGFPVNQLINITVNRVVQSKVQNFLKPTQSRGGTDGYFYHINSYDWLNAAAPQTGVPLTFTGFAVERGINSVASISTATNASPIQITTAAPHGLVTGQIVTIIGVTGNINANGTWPITVVDSLHFTLNGSTGSGTPNPNTGNVNVPKDMSTLIWDEVAQIWRFVFNTNGDGTTLGSSQSVKVNNFLMDGYLAIGPDPADTGAIRLSNNNFIFSESNPAGADIQLIGGDTLNRIKLGSLTTDTVYTPGIIDVDGYIQHDGTGSNTAQTIGFIRDQNNTVIVAFRNQVGSADIAALSSTTLNNVVLGDAVNGGVILNTATGNTHQFQVNSVPQVDIGTSFIRFANGVTLPTILQNTASIGINGQTLTVQAQNAAATGSGTGGSLNLTSGAGNAGPTANGVVNVQTGGTTRITVSDNTETYQIPNIQFANTVALPTISQVITAGAGTNMTVSAQSSSTTTGGNLILNSGLGNIVANDGYVVLQAGGLSQLVASAQNFPALHFPVSTGKVTVLGNLEVQGTLTTVDSTTVDIVGAVIHGNWADPTVSPNVSVPISVVGYSVHRGNLSGVPRDGASLIWTESTTDAGLNTSYGVTSSSTLFASDGYWRVISTPGDGFGVDTEKAGNSLASLGVLANNFMATTDPNPILGTMPGSGGLRNPNNVAASVARNITPSTTLVVSPAPLTLPQTTLTVVSTTGFTSTGSLLVQSSAGPQLVTYTSISGGNTFNGVVGGTGTIVTGGIVAQTNNSTTIAAGSNNTALPQTTISVTSTVGFPQSGTLRILTFGGPGTPGVPGNGGGIQTVTYSSIVGNTFQGVSLTGTGYMYTGNAVQLAPITGNADMHLLGTDFGNRILHGMAGLANFGQIFNTSNATTPASGIYDFQVNSVSQLQITANDPDADGYIELIQVAPTVANPRFYQLVQPYTGTNNGFNLMLQAQAGQQQTGATANNNGGNLTLSSGPAGTGGSGAAGIAGLVQINIGSTNNSTFNNVDTEADGYAEWLEIGPSIINPRLFQGTVGGTGANAGTNFKINAQAGQQQTGGNNNNNGGNLAFASGVPGTGGGGAAGSPGQIEFLWGSVLELTLTDGSLQWSNLTTTNPIFSQAATTGATGQVFTIQAQNAATTGGALVLTSGTGSASTSAGNVKIETGGVDRIITYPTGSPANLPTPATSNVPYTEFRDTAQGLFVVPVSAGTTSIGFASTVTAAQIAQVSTASTPSASMFVQSQVTTAASGVGGNLSLIAGNATGTTSTGGNLNLASGSGTTTNGVINFQPGGTTQILITSTGQFIQWVSTMANPTINQVTTGGASGTTLTVQAQNAATTGGDLTLTSGTGGTTAGNVNLQTGAVSRVIVHPTFTEFRDTAEALRITPVSAGTTHITFASTDTAASIDQTATAGATGANMTMQAQNATTTGGNAIVTSGTGTTAGNVQLQTGAVDRVVVHPTFTEFRDTAEAVRIVPVSAGTTEVRFAATDTAVLIDQTALASGTGANMTVQAQNAGTGTGGDLVLAAGTGTTLDGYVDLQAGGSNTARAHTNKFIFSKGWRRNITSVSTTYQVLVTDDFIAATTSSAYTVTMPSSPKTGDSYTIKDASGGAGTNILTISGNGTNIDGSASIVLNQAYAAVTLTFTGSQWSVT